MLTTADKGGIGRIVLKLSGEALMGDKQCGIDSKIIATIAGDIKSIIERQVQVGVVVGGGNFFRGSLVSNRGVSRIAGDNLGMLATMMNAIMMQDVFIRLQIPTKIVSAVAVDGLIERYSYRTAISYLDQGFVVIFAGGTGNPLVTTDTALFLRGIEINADLVLKATSVDGVYASDPKENPDAKFYKRATYDEILDKKIAVMDLTAFCLGRDYKMKLRVFNIFKQGALLRIVQGHDEGTLVE